MSETKSECRCPGVCWVHPTYTDQPAGDLDGYPVRAYFANATFIELVCKYDGVQLSTDGRDYLNLPTSGCCDGDMTLAEWARIKRLAAADVVERLIALAQRFDGGEALEVGK